MAEPPLTDEELIAFRAWRTVDGAAAVKAAAVRDAQAAIDAEAARQKQLLDAAEAPVRAALVTHDADMRTLRRTAEWRAAQSAVDATFAALVEKERSTRVADRASFLAATAAERQAYTDAVAARDALSAQIRAALESARAATLSDPKYQQTHDDAEAALAPLRAALRTAQGA